MNPLSVAEIVQAARDLLSEMAPEVRIRCAETTYLRLQSVLQSLDTAATLAAAPAPGAPADPAAAEPAPAPVPADAPGAPDLVGLRPELFAELLQVLGDRIAVEVRLAMEEAKPTTAQG